jgi:hypothetical protein
MFSDAGLAGLFVSVMACWSVLRKCGSDGNNLGLHLFHVEQIADARCF